MICWCRPEPTRYKCRFPRQFQHSHNINTTQDRGVAGQETTTTSRWGRILHCGSLMAQRLDPPLSVNAVEPASLSTSPPTTPLFISPLRQDGSRHYPLSSSCSLWWFSHTIMRPLPLQFKSLSLLYGIRTRYRKHYLTLNRARLPLLLQAVRWPFEFALSVGTVTMRISHWMFCTWFCGL